MNVLLVSANRERSPYPVFPIGLAYLVPPLASAGHRISVLDLCFADDPKDALAKALDTFSPDAAIVSIRNIDNVTFPASRSYLECVRNIINPLRGKTPVIVGGSGFSLMPAEVLSYLGADYGVVGEGEEVLPSLLASLAAGTTPTGLPGVLTKGESKWIPPEPVQNIGTPDRTLFDLSRYHCEGGMANVQTKRGCPFACTYCIYPLLEGSIPRLRPVAEIIAELRELVERFGVSYIYFVDDIFNYPPDFALELCRAMTRERLPLKWSAFVNPGFVTPQLLRSMIEAGCDAVEFGTDSGSPRLLESLGKSFTVGTIRDASMLCRELGVDFAHYILFGGPGEDEETILETFGLMDEINPTAVIAMTGIRIFPGTAIYQQALADGIIAPDASLLEPFFYLSPGIRDTICDIVSREAGQRRNWVVPGMEINISDAMLQAVRHFQVKGPLWKLMKRVGRSHANPLKG